MAALILPISSLPAVAYPILPSVLPICWYCSMMISSFCLISNSSFPIFFSSSLMRLCRSLMVLVQACLSSCTSWLQELSMALSYSRLSIFLLVRFFLISILSILICQCMRFYFYYLFISKNQKLNIRSSKSAILRVNCSSMIGFLNQNTLAGKSLGLQFGGIQNDTYLYMRKATLTLLLFIALCAITLQEQSEGERRLRKLKERSEASRGIIAFNADDFNEYAMQYPRPYSLVIYFTGGSCKLCDQLKEEYDYMATLYSQQGATKSAKNPVFFATITYSRENLAVFEVFGFKSIPNLVVSKPEMALVSELEKKAYLQKFKWAISYSDGDVTTHKMLDFANQRTGHNIFYKPTFKTMCVMFLGFIGVMAVGVFVYTKLKFLWTHWVVWFVGVLLIYITCVSGFIYDIIHNVPFVGRDRETGEAVIFAGGNREQYGAEGVVISLTISLIGLLFISIVFVSQKVQNAYKVRVFGFVALAAIYFLTISLESVYKTKSWYGPSLFPPQDYSHGSIAKDQGNNI